MPSSLTTLRPAPPSHRDQSCNIAAFLFDVDGVIADTAPLHSAAWKRLADEEGMAFTDADAQALRGLSRDDSLRRLLKGRCLSPKTFDALKNRKNDYYLVSLQSLSRKDVLPGFPRFLAQLQARRIRLAAVSASRNARKVLDQIDIFDRFEVIIDGLDESRAMGRLHRYHLAAAALHTAPDRCVVVEDSTAGIGLARSAGMKTLGLGDPQRLCTADVTLPSFELAHAVDVLSFFANPQFPPSCPRPAPAF